MKRNDVENFVRAAAEDLKKEFDATFRISKRGVPHILIRLYQNVYVSLCYFSSTDLWCTFYPFPGSRSEQTKTPFFNLENAKVFLRKLEVLEKAKFIKVSQMGTPDQVALGKIMRNEWPDLVAEIESFENYSRDKFLTEAIIVKMEGEVVGGAYTTTHKKELEKFIQETPRLNGENLIVAEYFVMKAEVRNRGIGRQLLEFIQRKYLPILDGVILKSNIIETQNFYKRLGGDILFAGAPHGTEYHSVWKKKILSKGTTFLYTLESCNITMSGR